MMKKEKTGVGKSPENIRIVIISLAPEGSAAADKVAGMVTDSWHMIGRIDVVIETACRNARDLGTLLRRWSDRGRAEIILTIGKSGHLAEDFAPDVTVKALQRRLPGIEERMCLTTPRKPEDLLFRGAAGMRKNSLIVNLPVRPGRVRQIIRFLTPLLGHALEKIAGSESECGG